MSMLSERDTVRPSLWVVEVLPLVALDVPVNATAVLILGDAADAQASIRAGRANSVAVVFPRPSATQKRQEEPGCSRQSFERPNRC